jgi:Interferon-induced transmembrane protein
MSYGHTPGAEQEHPTSLRYGQPESGMPGYAPAAPPPPAYRAWAIVAGIGGVLFNVILGVPAAIIGGRYSKKVTELWADGHGQAAISASRKARAWLIASTVFDTIGIILLVVFIMQTSSSQSNFSSPSVVAASIKTQLQHALSSPSSQAYEPGVTVTSVVCTPSGTNTDHCVDTFSTGQTLTETAVISGNGTSYTTH